MNRKIIATSLILVSLGLVYFFFVPAFQGKIIVTPIINLGFFSVRWYGLIMALAVLSGFLIARKNAWKFGIEAKQVADFVFWMVIISGVGARLYFVLFEFGYFFHNPIEIFKVWNGGISIYGAIITGFVFTFFYARRKGFSQFQLLDLTALSLPLAQAVGRFGNFFNQEAFGNPTELPWKMFVSLGNRPHQFADSSFFHPAFLYEALWNLVVFYLLMKLIGKHRSGMMAGIYLILYSFGRFVVEGIRLDSQLIFGLRVDQIVAVVVFVGGGLFVLKLWRVSQTQSSDLHIKGS
ncbi:MAG: prolipoprotein diacylglyceryl transferase [bacterium]|nr:prolipoprotein diacylglyceryl transferase [bacterium]